mmetsp:Transcript_65238/g.210329  ORF Transcript_65238/g.210329 Transcript_65238/m.210329 type:complete len:216 (+) Transcript_65238:537-1184(+)
MSCCKSPPMFTSAGVKPLAFTCASSSAHSSSQSTPRTTRAKLPAAPVGSSSSSASAVRCSRCAAPALPSSAKAGGAQGIRVRSGSSAAVKRWPGRQPVSWKHGRSSGRPASAGICLASSSTSSSEGGLVELQPACHCGSTWWPPMGGTGNGGGSGALPSGRRRSRAPSQKTRCSVAAGHTWKFLGQNGCTKPNEDNILWVEMNRGTWKSKYMKML